MLPETNEHHGGQLGHLRHETRSCRFTAVDGWLGAPLASEQVQRTEQFLWQAQEIDQDGPVESDAVLVVVGLVGGQELRLPELVEDAVSVVDLLRGQRLRVEREELWQTTDCDSGAPLLLLAAEPPEAH